MRRWLKFKLAEWSMHRWNRRHIAGWNYAAGEMLGGASPEALEEEAEGGLFFDGPNGFDEGIKDACRMWADGITRKYQP